MSGPNSPAQPRHRRQGSVLAAVIVLLLILEIAIASLLMSSTNEQGVGVDRLNTVCAFYAAEAGTQMALRELVLGVDEDGDGVTGGISDDGDAATNPVLGGASVYVRAATAANVTILTSEGTCGGAVRAMQATVDD